MWFLLLKANGSYLPKCVPIQHQSKLQIQEELILEQLR
jgi:hypothetical protein